LSLLQPPRPDGTMRGGVNTAGPDLATGRAVTLSKELDAIAMSTLAASPGAASARCKGRRRDQGGASEIGPGESIRSMPSLPESLPSDSNRLGDHGVLDVTQARDGGDGRRGKSAQEEIRADTPLRVSSSQGVAAVLEKPQRHLSTREPTTVTLADDHRGHRIITE